MAIRKLIKPALLAASIAMAGNASAGIPVFDGAALKQLMSIDENIVQGFVGNGENIHASTESIVRAIDYLGQSLGMTIVNTETNSLKAERSLDITEDFNPDLAKTSIACTVLNAAGARAGGGRMSRSVAKATSEYASKENMRTNQLPQGESRSAYNHKEAIDRLTDEETAEDTVLVFRDEPFEEDDLDKVMALVQYATNPIAQALPSQEDLDIIKEHGAPGEKSMYARVLVQNDRLKRMQMVLQEQKYNDLQKHDRDSFAYMLDRLHLTDEQRANITEKLSENQLNELMATFRGHSPDWVTEIHTVGEKGILTDMALMNAEQLRLLWSIERGINTLVSITAQAEANRLNQEGATQH